MAKGSKRSQVSADYQATVGWDFGRAIEVIGRYVRQEAGADQAEAEQAINYLSLRPVAKPKTVRTKK